MAVNNFFSHHNLQGEDPGERLEKEGVRWNQYAENIAAGPNAIFANNGWINSWGHRENMLGDTEQLGVGSYLSDTSSMITYHTQKYVTER